MKRELLFSLAALTISGVPAAFGGLCDGSPIQASDKIKLVAKANIDGKDYTLECMQDLKAPVYLRSDVMTIGSKIVNYKFECKKPNSSAGPLVSLDIKGLNTIGQVISPQKKWSESPNVAVKYMPEMKDKKTFLEIHSFGLDNPSKPQHFEKGELELTSLNQNAGVESGKGLFHEWQGCFKGAFKKTSAAPGGTLELYFAGRNFDYTLKERYRNEKGDWVK